LAKCDSCWEHVCHHELLLSHDANNDDAEMIKKEVCLSIANRDADTFEFASFASAQPTTLGVATEALCLHFAMIHSGDEIITFLSSLAESC
jgi:hypothetical protein